MMVVWKEKRNKEKRRKVYYIEKIKGPEREEEKSNLEKRK